MLVCLRRGLSLLRQHRPRPLPPLSPRPARLLLLSSLHLSTEAMGDPAVVPDGAYLEAVTPKRIRIFEEIQARQALERLNIGGEPIKWVFGRVFCFITSSVNS